MIVSFNWLADYVQLDMPVEQLTHRLMMAGLNHESTTTAGDDLAIDLEVTSNRPDWLGHLGIAREVAVLWQRELQLPAAEPSSGRVPVGELTRVRLDCPKLCFRYTARVIRGIKIGPSPKWLADRLRTVGIEPINNVVDVTNYVLMECGQPLHAFDLKRLAGQQIIVREARPGEKFLAINHRTYELEPGMCVIADAERAVALGGVMGGADTEVSESTTDLLIESAEFAPMSVRSTARRLGLHSDSSYRFERGVDPAGIDWASRRSCALILELAGGELAEGSIDVGEEPRRATPVALRYAQIPRILGIEVPRSESKRILAALGNRVTRDDAISIEVVPPSWRRDLTREIDLVEEVARIHGYEAIPEDVNVPMATSHRTASDRVLARVRQVLTAAGIDEAMTTSAVEEPWSEVFSPWTNEPALQSQIPVLRRADRLRRSLVPSLLGARRANEAVANPVIELFEIARAYLPQPKDLPREELLLAITSGGRFLHVKGVLETLLQVLNPKLELRVEDAQLELLERGRSVALHIGDELWGYLGEVSPAGLKQFELRASTTIAEVRIAPLVQNAALIPKAVELSPFPAVDRDLNFVVDEPVRWAELERVVRGAAGPAFESLEFKDEYRDPQRLGPGKKSLLLTVSFRGAGGTLTSQEVDLFRDQIVAACQRELKATLRA